MSNSFPGFFGGRTPEFVPSIDQLSVLDNRQPLLDDCIVETADDPYVNLSTLSDAEGPRLHLRVVGSTNFEGYANSIASAMGKVDYCIVEHTLPGTSNSLRRTHDIALNLGLRGVALQVERPGEQSDNTSDELPAVTTIASDLQREDSFVTAYARFIHHQDRSPLPVVRTMGLSDYDVIPDFGMRVKDADDWKKKLLDGIEAGLPTMSNESLINAYANSFTFSVPKEIALERQRQIAVSIIAANAVRRHPDKEEITVGVLQRSPCDSYEDQLLFSLMCSGAGKLKTATQAFIPHLTDPAGGFMQDPHARALREAMTAPDKRPSQDAMKRALLSNYLRATLLDNYEGDKEKTEQMTRTVDARLAMAGVESLLQRIDEAKTEKLSGFRFNQSKTPEDVRRWMCISKVVIDSPAIKFLLADAK